MPFDSAPVKKPLTRAQKLERLLYHLNQATDAEQHSFCQCLAHRCACDPVLVDDGLPQPFWIRPAGRPIDTPYFGSTKPWYHYFGINPGDSCYGSLFGGDSVELKRRWVSGLLAKEYVR